MRVAYVCADLGVPVFGRKGCSIHVQEVLRAFVGLGAEVDLFASRIEEPAPADLKSIRVHEIPVRALGGAASREQAALGANRHLRAALEYEEPFDLVYERYSLWSYAGMEYAQEAGIPGLLEVNAPLIEEQVRYRQLVDRSGAKLVAERAFAAASGLVAVSDEVAAYLNTYPEARGRIHVIPNGVNPSRFRPGLSSCISGNLHGWLRRLPETLARLGHSGGSLRYLVPRGTSLSVAHRGRWTRAVSYRRRNIQARLATPGPFHRIG